MTSPQPLGSRSPLLSLVAVLVALAGCGGGSHLNLNLLRDVSHDKPVYVGIYYLSQEAAVDAASIPELIDAPEQFTEGVVARQVLPVYPGEVKSIPMENYAPEIRWIAIVADFGETAECARVKREVPGGAKLDLTISIEERCLEVQ